MKQKYVTFASYQGEQHLIVFPEFIQHSVFAEHVQLASPYSPMNPISAGFVVDAQCMGVSESLRLKSRPAEDTDLLIAMLDISQQKLREAYTPRSERTKNQLKRDRKKAA
jgi:hypothetical protein